MEQPKEEKTALELTKLTKEDLKLLVNVLVATPTQNLQSAQSLIALSNKLSKMVDECK